MLVRLPLGFRSQSGCPGLVLFVIFLFRSFYPTTSIAAPQLLTSVSSFVSTLLLRFFTLFSFVLICFILFCVI